MKFKFYVVLIPLLVAACSSSRQVNTSSMPATFATVNDRTIPTKLYQMYLENGREALELDTTTEEGRRELDKLRQGIVSELVDRTLIALEAEQMGLSIPPDRLAAAEKRAMAELGGEKLYAAYLSDHGLTHEEYREVIKLEVYGEIFRNELSKNVVITDQEIQEYYETHKDDLVFQQPERVTASHILIQARTHLISQQIQREKQLEGIALTDAVRDELERRRERAKEIHSKAIAGADFAALAREHSEDPETRDRGGDLGSFPRASHAGAFDEAAFALGPAQVSDVVQTEFGFHVIKVFDKQPARRLSLAEATPEIRRRLFEERETKRLSEWLKDARGKAAVKINEPFQSELAPLENN